MRPDAPLLDARWIANFAAQALALLASLIDRLIVVGLLLRCWGADVYAGWTVLLSSAGALTLADLGMALCFGNLLQKAQAQGDSAALQRSLGVAQFVYLALTALLAVLGVAALGLGAAATLAAGRIDVAEASCVLALLGAATLLRVARGAMTQLYRAHRQFARGILVDLAAPLAIAAGGVVAALAEWRPATLAGLQLLCELSLGWGFMRADLRRRFPALNLRPLRPSASELSALAARLPWFAALQAAAVAQLHAPVLILGASGVGSAALVGFVLARTMINLLRQLVTMSSLAMGVEGAHDHHRGERATVLARLSALGRVAVAATVAGSLALLMLGEGFVTLWTGRPELFDRSAAAWLCAGAVLAATTTPLTTFLTLVDARPAALAAAAQASTMVAATLALAPAYSGAGAARGAVPRRMRGRGADPAAPRTGWRVPARHSRLCRAQPRRSGGDGGVGGRRRHGRGADRRPPPAGRPRRRLRPDGRARRRAGAARQPTAGDAREGARLPACGVDRPHPHEPPPPPTAARYARFLSLRPRGAAAASERRRTRPLASRAHGARAPARKRCEWGHDARRRRSAAGR